VADREQYTGVRAAWQDKATATRQTVLVGKADNALVLQALHASQADAQASAQAEWTRMAREGITLEMDLAYGRPDLSPQMTLRLPDVKAPFNRDTWLIVKITHTLAENGLTSKIEAETAETAAGRARDEKARDEKNKKEGEGEDKDSVL